MAGVLSLVKIMLNDLCGHIGQEEHCLKYWVEVASVSNVFEPHWQRFISLSLLDSQRLVLQLFILRRHGLLFSQLRLSADLLGLTSVGSRVLLLRIVTIFGLVLLRLHLLVGHLLMRALILLSLGRVSIRCPGMLLWVRSTPALVVPLAELLWGHLLLARRWLGVEQVRQAWKHSTPATPTLSRLLVQVDLRLWVVLLLLLWLLFLSLLEEWVQSGVF